MNATAEQLMTLPGWAVMWAIAFSLYFLAKAAVWRMRPAGTGAGGTGWLAAGWWLAWPGMSLAGWDRRDAKAGPGREEADCETLCVAGMRNLLLGAALVWGVARWMPHPLAAGWVGMAGVVLMLHFGVFHLAAGFWRSVGVPARPVMVNPLAAVTLAEFWGRRWNTAFRDLARGLIFTPVARRWGEAAATWAVFVVSGLVHELVISVPAGAGYGLPTAYFLLQAAGLMAERRYCTLSRALKHGRTVLFVSLPAFFLFHPPFVEGVMIPFFHVIGALS